MYSFNNDYSEIAHPKIIELLYKYQAEQNIGYGLDYHSKQAKELIKKHFTMDVEIHFLIGGTSANKIVIDHLLRPYEAVIAVDSGHINTNETGAIEASGHKIITTTGIDGKITASEIKEIVARHQSEHMVIPKLVYISNSTEVGTIYSKEELTNIWKVCQELNLYLFLDGARLGAALTSKDNDLTLDDIARLTDVFYIGGTKNGAMLGEAVVITNPKLRPNFRHSVKRNGGLLAKGFLTGIQFEALFTDNLFFDLATHANQAAQILTEGLKKSNINFTSPPQTILLCVALDNVVICKLQEKYLFEVWMKNEKDSIIRLVTSWATDYKKCQEFIEDLHMLINKK